jgi:hypothetical protein
VRITSALENKRNSITNPDTKRLRRIRKSSLGNEFENTLISKESLTKVKNIEKIVKKI